MPAVAPHLKLDNPEESQLVTLDGPTIQHRQAELFNANDPRNVSGVKVTTDEGPTYNAGVRNFHVTLCRDDQPCTFEEHSIEFRPNQDVLDLLLVMEINGKTHFGLTESFRPVLATRSDKESHETEDGMVLSLAGGYLNSGVGLDSINRTAARLVSNKLGLTEHCGEILSLGGPSFPNPRASTELARPVAMYLDPAIGTESKVCYGNGLQATQITHWLTLEQILDKFTSGEIKDLRAIDAVLRHVRINTEINSLPSMQDVIAKPGETSHLTLATERRILTAEDVRRLLADPAKLARNISQIKLEERSSNQSDYLLAQRALAQISRLGGSQEEIKIDVISHPTKPDSFDVTSYFIHKGQPYLVIRDADRPAIAARELAEHPIYSPYPATHFEAIGGTIERGLDLNQQKAIALKYVENNFGISPNSDLKKIGVGYPSPGFNAELETHFMLAIDPNKTALTADSSVHFISLKDAFELIDEGLIRDLRFSLGAHLVAAATNNLHSRELLRTPEQRSLKNRYLKLINDGSQLTAWLCSEDDSRKMMSRLLEDPWARRLVYLSENILGQVFAKLSHSDERNFFSPIIPIYAMLKDKPSALLALHYFHDLRHYSCGDQVPVRLKDGQTFEAVPYEEFLEIYRENELVAGFFSDYIVPAVVGEKKAHEIMGRPNLKEMFDEFGIGQDEAYELYCQIEGQGTIPDRLLANVEVYRKYRTSPIGDMIYAHHIFASHARAVYQNWVNHPLVSEIILRFSDRAFFETAEQLKLFDSTTREVRDYTEGFNPLQAFISRTITWNIQREAARIAFFVEENKELSVNDRASALEEINKLHRIYSELLSMRSSITDIEASEKNLAIFNRVEGLLSNELSRLPDISKELLSKLPIEKQRAYAGRELPFFKPLPFVDTSMFPQPPEI